MLSVAKHLLYLIEKEMKGRSLSRMRDRDDMIGGFSAAFSAISNPMEELRWFVANTFWRWWVPSLFS
jgi:hypothetical protein